MAQFNQYRNFIGTRIVNDSSLIFYYDMSNEYLSFKGKPTTNLFSNPDFSSGWTLTGMSGFTTPLFSLPDIKLSESTGTSTRSFSQNFTVTSGQSYTVSIYLRPAERSHFQITSSSGTLDGYSVPTPTTSDYANFTLDGTGSVSGQLNSTGATSASIKLIKHGPYKNWYRCTYKDVATSSGTGTFTFAFLTSSSDSRLQSYSGTQGNGLYVRDPQAENSTFATPFVDGTRSSTETIVDLTGTFTPNATSLTYNADGTFSYSGAAANGGANDRITVGIGSYPTAWTDPFSIEAWFKIPSGADWQDTVSGGDNSGTGIVSRGDYGGAIGLWTKDLTKIRFTVRSVGNLYGHIHDAQFDTWYHVVGTHDGGTTNALKTYVNGVLVGTNSFTNQGDAPDQQNWIVGGANALGGAGGGYFEGDIPIVRIYSKALTAAEVKQNFIAHKGRFGL